MIFKKTFTNGKSPKGGVNTISTRIPLIEYNQIIQTKSSVEIIVALLNEKENLYSYAQKNSLIWKVCQHCQTIFISYRKNEQTYCSYQCNGYYRGQEWGKVGYLGALSLTSEIRKTYSLKGDKNPAWKGGLTYMKRKGKYANQSIKYVRCPKEFITMARKDGYVMEHRLNVAMEIGGPLLRTECVHHTNHNAEINELWNLMLFKTNSDHKRYEHGQDIKPLWQPLPLLSIQV